MIVIAIIGILAVIAIPEYESYIETTKATLLTQDYINAVQQAQDAVALARTGTTVYFLDSGTHHGMLSSNAINPVTGAKIYNIGGNGYNSEVSISIDSITPKLLSSNYVMPWRNGSVYNGYPGGLLRTGFSLKPVIMFRRMPIGCANGTMPVVTVTMNLNVRSSPKVMQDAVSMLNNDHFITYGTLVATGVTSGGEVCSIG